jgi:hypothetical protein
MKKPILVCSILVCSIFCQAQIVLLNGPTKQFADSLNKIVLDFKNNFSTIKGKQLNTEPEAIVFVSKICLPAAKNCIIKKYTSTEDKTASWQALLYSSDNFDETIKMYKKFFAQIKAVNINGVDKISTSFFGKLEKMDENVRFFTSTLRLKTDNVYFKNLAVAIELTNNYAGWDIYINIYSKKIEADDDGADE